MNTTSRDMELLRRSLEQPPRRILRREGHMIDPRPWSVPMNSPYRSSDDNALFNSRDSAAPLVGALSSNTETMTTG